MLVSVIVPCYNQGVYLHEALDSIFAWHIDFEYEIIVVNDGSTDSETVRIIEALDTSRLEVINQPNQGLAAARNNGIKLSTGKYILPLDADNKLDKGYFVDAVEVLENRPAVDIVYGNPLFFGEENGVRLIKEFSFKSMLQSNYIDACALYRREVWEKAGGYDGNMPFMGNEDWELWIHAFLQGASFFHLNKICFHYRVLANAMSVTTTRPGYQANKDYIHAKHAKQIIEHLLPYAVETEALNDFYNQNKLRTAIELLVGRNL